MGRGPLWIGTHTEAIGGVEPPGGENPPGGIDHPPGCAHLLAHLPLVFISQKYRPKASGMARNSLRSRYSSTPAPMAATLMLRSRKSPIARIATLPAATRVTLIGTNALLKPRRVQIDEHNPDA